MTVHRFTYPVVKFSDETELDQRHLYVQVAGPGHLSWIKFPVPKDLDVSSVKMQLVLEIEDQPKVEGA